MYGAILILSQSNRHKEQEEQEWTQASHANTEIEFRPPELVPRGANTQPHARQAQRLTTELEQPQTPKATTSQGPSKCMLGTYAPLPQSLNPWVQSFRPQTQGFIRKKQKSPAPISFLPKRQVVPLLWEAFRDMSWAQGHAVLPSTSWNPRP